MLYAIAMGKITRWKRYAVTMKDEQERSITG